MKIMYFSLLFLRFFHNIFNCIERSFDLHNFVRFRNLLTLFSSNLILSAIVGDDLFFYGNIDWNTWQ